jgi:RNA polymerase sigma factor (sigma-70 family)
MTLQTCLTDRPHHAQEKTSAPNEPATFQLGKSQLGQNKRPIGGPEDPLTLLFLKVQQGELGAENELFEKLTTTYTRLVRQRLGQKNYRLTADQIDDLVQDLLIDTWRFDLLRFDPSRGELLSFLRKRVQWKIVDHLRVHSRHACDSLEKRREDLKEEPGSEDEGPECIHARYSHERHLFQLPRKIEAKLDLMNDLSARTAVLRHDVDGIPLKAVADELGIHPSNATRARQRGLIFLREVCPPVWREAA